MFDALFLWCSEVGHGTVASFRQSFSWLAETQGPSALTWAGALANFSALGHVEVDWERGKWAVAPTVLATMPNSGGFALLVGGQPRWLLRDLDRLEDHEDREIRELSADVVFQPPVIQRSGPSARYVAIENEDSAQDLCKRLGIHYGGWVADELAAMLPSLPTMLRERGELVGPAGIDPQRMTTGGRDQWAPCDTDRPDGAYVYKRHGPPHYVFRLEGRGFVADKRTVVYAELARTERWVLRYDAARREMLVPARMQLPMPHNRASVLNSGLLPTLSKPDPSGRPSVLDSCVRYINIDLPFAQTVARSLEQRLQLVQ